MKPKFKILLIKILLGFFILICLWSFFIEPNIIEVEKISIKIENLPISFKGTKIIQLSDFHSKKFGKKEKKVLQILNDLKPDFIFITGDVIDWKTKNFKEIQKFWLELSKKFEGKIFAIYGNHDYWNRDFKIFDILFKESKIKILNNQSEKIKKGEDFIYLIGISEPCPNFDGLNYNNFRKICYDKLQKIYHNNLQIIFKGVGDEKIPKILLAHSPEIFREVKNFSSKIDLTLVGHTHGGQINIPFLANLILPVKYDKKYKEGLFKEDSKYLYVNRGVGESGLPIRFNSFPEITLIELK
ncbi:metallophosphoesterase [Candidatus Kuenenbacteria bacterium]|nr:metallophosphoesterase [Candidatus Kuenenbacteria bacterium]